MKICIISESFLPKIGGLQFELKYLMEELLQYPDVEIYFVTLAEGGEQYVRSDAKDRFHYVQLSGRWSLVALIRTIHRINPDVIHAHTTETFSTMIAVLKKFRLCRIPFFITSHGVDIMTESSAGYGWRLHPLYNLLVRFILSQVDRHILVGKTMKPFALSAGSTESQIRIINNGIPLREKKIDASAVARVCEQYNITSSHVVLLSLSGLRPLKGIEYLIQAMPSIVHQIPHALLLIACKGGGSYEVYIRSMVEKLHMDEHVKFIGFIRDEEEKAALVQRADMFCKPSLLEACSVAILEALREGTCVVASHPGGDDILTDKKDGMVVPVKDAQAFARAVIELYTNTVLRSSIEQETQQTIQRFSIEHIAQRYYTLYRTGDVS